MDIDDHGCAVFIHANLKLEEFTLVVYAIELAVAEGDVGKVSRRRRRRSLYRPSTAGTTNPTEGDAKVECHGREDTVTRGGSLGECGFQEVEMMVMDKSLYSSLCGAAAQ